MLTQRMTERWTRNCWDLPETEPKHKKWDSSLSGLTGAKKGDFQVKAISLKKHKKNLPT